MPEIAEVERDRLRIHRQLIDYKVIQVENDPDTLVYKDVEPEVFGKTLLNRTLVNTKRWGKYFILLFDEGPSIVAHLGMTGGVRFKHELKPEEWPPKYWKLLIKFQHPTDKDKVIHFGLKDPRRLARLRLVHGKDPLLEDPINKLGFDPVLNLPAADVFNKMVLKRAVPVKALLLDQSFSAGVGNWVADEVLYQSRLHPAQYTNTLNEEELKELYEKLKFVCETAVKAEADETKFPEDWLMKYRWGKGKSKKTKHVLPNGLALQFETVGGRTSAFAPERQKLRKSVTATVTKKVIVKKETKTIYDKKKKKPTRNNVKKEKNKKKVKEEEKEIVATTTSTMTASAIAKEEEDDEEKEMAVLANEVKTRIRVSSRYNFRQK